MSVATPCPGCSEQLGARYGPEQVCWSCWERKHGGIGSVPEPDWYARTRDLEEIDRENGITYSEIVVEPSRNGHAIQLDEDDELIVDMRAALEAADADIDFPLWPIAARGFLTVLAARHSSYKTFLMLLAGHAVQRGDASIAGMACQQTTVLYVDAENGPRLMAKRFRAAGIPAEGLTIADGTQLRLPADMRRLGALIDRTDAGFVVLDSLRRLAPGVKENDSDSVAPLVADIAKLAREHNAAIVLIHHRSSKDGAALLRGSSAIEDQADLVFTLDRKPNRVCKLSAAKFRLDDEPPSLWLRFGQDFTTALFGLQSTEPSHDDDAPKENENETRVFDAIRYAGSPPTFAEIISETGLAKSTLHGVLDRLTKRGRIDQTDNVYRVRSFENAKGNRTNEQPNGGEE